MKLFLGCFVVLKIHIPVVSTELRNAVIDNFIIDITTAEIWITSRSRHLNCAFVDCNDGYIESAASKIKDENVLVIGLLQIYLL